MFLFKLKIWNFIQHDLGFDPFSPETVLFFMLCFMSKFHKLLTFYPRINKNALYVSYNNYLAQVWLLSHRLSNANDKETSWDSLYLNLLQPQSALQDRINFKRFSASDCHYSNRNIWCFGIRMKFFSVIWLLL